MNRKLFAVVLVATVTLIGCATQSAMQNMNPVEALVESSPHHESAPPKLLLEAYPKVGFAPLRVSIRAVLQNVPAKDPVFGCMWESWNFGDGSVSSEKENCVGPDSSVVEPEYFVEHLYREEGVYQVRFVLGDRQLLSNPVTIRVL